MIESRYKIEYVLPDDDVKKTSSLKLFWYFLLIPLIICVVTLITYDFSLQNISRDSLVLVEKAKVYIFNLEDKPLDNEIEKIKTEKLLPLASEKTQKIAPSVSKTTSIPTKKIEPKNQEDKKLIGELTAKQELQLKTIREQVEKNSQLNENLNELSNQLVLEKSKNESLYSKLTEQQEDRLELELQLKKALAESENKEIIINVTSELNDQAPILTIKDDNVEIVDTVSIESTTEVIPLEKEKSNQGQPIEKVSKNQEPNKISETDKIVEAMTSINASNKKVEAPKTPLTAEEISTNLDSVDTETQNINMNKNDLAEKTKEPEVIIKLMDDSAINAKTPIKVTNEPTKITPKSESKAESKVKETKELDSSVDAIIAAMENTQVNKAAEETSSKQTENNELKKEDKQQVVEKGDLEVDN